TGLTATLPGRRIAGQCRTVKLAAGNAPPGAPVRHLGASAIDASAEGEIIVVEQATGRDAGCWGGILSRGAQIKGIAGVIAEGPVRDVDEAREIGFPIFCRAFTAFTARARVHEAATDVPVTVGGVTVDPGMIAVADSSAVVFIPEDRAEDVLTAVTRIARREAEMIRRLEAGERAGDVLGANYEHLLRRPDNGE
ncbi:MAG TPA: RraA family protein, partial [Sphingomonadaceae bacterium]|nr:RraA family protein [Sphingomonadaceae bacterium]